YRRHQQFGSDAASFRGSRMHAKHPPEHPPGTSHVAGRDQPSHRGTGHLHAMHADGTVHLNREAELSAKRLEFFDTSLGPMAKPETAPLMHSPYTERLHQNVAQKIPRRNP